MLKKWFFGARKVQQVTPEQSRDKPKLGVQDPSQPVSEETILTHDPLFWQDWRDGFTFTPRQMSLFELSAAFERDFYHWELELK